MANRSTSPTVAEAYRGLVKALGTAEASCAGDDRFTADDADPAPLVAICRSCPVFAQCRDVALASAYGPIFGVVGGLVRRGSSPSTLTRSA